MYPWLAHALETPEAHIAFSMPFLYGVFLIGLFWLTEFLDLFSHTAYVQNTYQKYWHTIEKRIQATTMMPSGRVAFALCWNAPGFILHMGHKQRRVVPHTVGGHIIFFWLRFFYIFYKNPEDGCACDPTTAHTRAQLLRIQHVRRISARRMPRGLRPVRRFLRGIAGCIFRHFWLLRWKGRDPGDS